MKLTIARLGPDYVMFEWEMDNEQGTEGETVNRAI